MLDRAGHCFWSFVVNWPQKKIWIFKRRLNCHLLDIFGRSIDYNEKKFDPAISRNAFVCFL